MKRGYVDTPHGQIHYRTEGSSGAPVIVFHETPSSSARMAPIVHELGKEMQAFGMDTMGYGSSDRPPAPYTTMSEFAQSVAWFIEGLGKGPANLFGVLTGAQIALQTAAEHPDLVKAVAVSEAFNWGVDSRRAVHERIHRYFPRSEDGSHIMELWNRSRFQTDVKLREQSLRDHMAVNDDTGADVYGGMGWEGAGPYAMCRTVIWDVTPKIQAPTLVMYSKNSERGRALARFLDTLPRAKGDDDAPSFRTDPAATARLLIDFFNNPGI
jgi:pimeloyl-ACP methyl ester carboxylesterase